MPSKHAILFVTPFDLDTHGVNIVTWRHGFGHVALWSGLVERGEPIVLDSSIRSSTNEGGVQFRPLLAMTRGVKYAKLELDEQLGRYMLHRALACIGKPYDTGGLFRGRRNDSAYTCSGLICCALPIQLETRCREVAASMRRPVSPNSIAIALGVPKWSPSP